MIASKVAKRFSVRLGERWPLLQSKAGSDSIASLGTLGKLWSAWASASPGACSMANYGISSLDEAMRANLKAPFPWFGGKSRVARAVWERFGDVANYVEPFAGSLAVLLGRPTNPRVETVNDLDCYLSNWWRAVAADPELVAHHADWPVNEADLHARHLWLVNRAEFREHMKTDPGFYDAQIAGWWVWGISQWIGSGWCDLAADRKHTGRTRNGGVQFRRPQLSTDNQVNSIHKRPLLSGHSGGLGVHRKRVFADGANAGRGAHKKMPQVQRGWGFGVNSKELVKPVDGLYSWFTALAGRLRRVRVCCGDWTRILGPAVTTCIGTTAVFLDPPYSVEDRSDVYSHESRDVAHAVREWALAHGDDPDLRIALCGYEGEHAMPESWECIAWKAAGGYGSQGDGVGRQNAGRERIWFSSGCLGLPLFRDARACVRAGFGC